MNAKQLQDVSKQTDRSMGELAWWLGASLAILAALAIALAIYHAPKAANPPVRAQSAPDAAAQAAAAHLRAPDDPSFHAPRVPYYVPLDQSFHILPASKSVAVAPPLRPQTVPGAGDYLHVPNSVRASHAP